MCTCVRESVCAHVRVGETRGRESERLCVKEREGECVCA